MSKNIKIINHTQFKKRVNNKLNGIYVFIADDCSLCDTYMKNLENFGCFSDITVINCLENIDYYMKEFGLDNMPYTLIFKEGKEVYEAEGVLYEKQLRELKGAENDLLYSTM